MSKNNTKKQTILTGGKLQKQNTKTQQINQKLPEDMESEIRDCFNFYDTDKSGYITRSFMRSILGNFGFINKNVRDIEDEIRDEIEETKNQFSLRDVLQIITKKWFYGKGREDEVDEVYELFARKDKKIGLNEIKAVFGQYLDIQISDADIMEFIHDADSDGDGQLNKRELATKMGYI